MPFITMSVIECPTTGELGFLLPGTPREEGITVDWGSGGLIAHDLVEHQNGASKIGCPYDEFEALGALWISRGRYGRGFRGYGRSNESILSVDVTQAIEKIADEGAYWRWKPSRPHDEDEAFREIIDMAIKSWEQSFAETYLENYGEAFDIASLRNPILHCMRRGARKIIRRWGSDDDAYRTYEAVREAVHGVRNSIEWEGQVFRLEYAVGYAEMREVEQTSLLHHA